MILYCSACQTIKEVPHDDCNHERIVLTCGHIAYWNDDTSTWEV